MLRNLMELGLFGALDVMREDCSVGSAIKAPLHLVFDIASDPLCNFVFRNRLIGIEKEKLLVAPALMSAYTSTICAEPSVDRAAMLK